MCVCGEDNLKALILEVLLGSYQSQLIITRHNKGVETVVYWKYT